MNVRLKESEVAAVCAATKVDALAPAVRALVLKALDRPGERMGRGPLG